MNRSNVAMDANTRKFMRMGFVMRRDKKIHLYITSVFYQLKKGDGV